jgi:SIR2-like domain
VVGLASLTGSTLVIVIDPLISIAFSVHSNPGGYALLLGSGVSRAAGVPTGWEVVTDLIENVAKLEGEDTAGDPGAWFRARYSAEPSYSALLAELAAEPAERNRLLRAYFEPTEEEREEGLKVPTEAHRAIARLAQAGYVRVIVTTNFDRLLELALTEVGVVPTVLATPDAVEGALPLAHTNCTIVKVHGDYLDARIRNTPDELAHYDKRIDSLLDRIFDEYGLIVCGWSAEWDAALRDAISRSPTRRFTTYWTARGKLGPEARLLLENRSGVQVPIKDANSFFVELDEKVRALADLQAPHPLSTKVAVATLKRYLADDRHKIRLYDLLADEVTRVEKETSIEAMPVDPGQDTSQDAGKARLARYEAICETLVSLMAFGARWAEDEQLPLFTGVLERLGNRWREPNQGSALVRYQAMLDYPATLALYGAGLGALAGDRLETLAHVLGDVRVVRLGKRKPLLHVVSPSEVIDGAILQRPPNQGRLYTPVNDHLAEVLREPLRELIPSESFTALFDRFEYLLSLAYADLAAGNKIGDSVWAPIGSYVWRHRWEWGEEGGFREQVAAEAREAEEDSGWTFLHGPLFEGDIERFFDLQKAVDKHFAHFPMY